jgi:hypothetical protein
MNLRKLLLRIVELCRKASAEFERRQRLDDTMREHQRQILAEIERPR